MQSGKVSQGEGELVPSEAFPPQMDSLFCSSQLESEYRFGEMAGLGREGGSHLKLLFDLFKSSKKDVHSCL